ncbi:MULTISPECIES: hypothetical protein [unclassified Microcoleus]|uniref:hypothetical protein n=1 Tax=unclassified Microcoleus TaxID=2642155 RepID=UPI0025FA7051|nr:MULTISPECIES: hypothetical protein [unclassified Microcoleus]
MFYFTFYFIFYFATVGDGNFGQAVTDITKQGEQASNLVSQSMDGLWNDVLGGGLYAAICKLGLFFAIGTFVLFMVNWTKAMMYDENIEAFSELIWPIIVIIFLSNSGANLSKGTIGLRNIINEANRSFLESTSGSMDLQAAYRQAMISVGMNDALRGQLQQCSLEPPALQKTCVEKVQKQAESMPKSPSGGGLNPNLIKGAVDGAVAQLQTQLVLFVKGLLLAFGMAFQWIVEISMLLTGLLGPLAMGGSLLPVGQKAIFAWLTGFFSIGMVKICFNIISGLTATLFINSKSGMDLVFAICVGIIAPVLSLVLAAGAGMAVFTSLSTLGQTLMSGGMSFAGSAAGRIAGSFSAGKSAASKATDSVVESTD